MKTEKQNRKKEFNKLNLSMLSFENKKPQNQLEREYFKQLDQCLQYLNMKAVIRYLPEKLAMKNNKPVLISGKKHILQNSGYYVFIGDNKIMLNIRPVENIKNSVVWKVFGEHYTARKLAENFTPEQRLKIEVLILRCDLSRKNKTIKDYENKICSVVPIDLKTKQGILSAFMRRKRKYKFA